MVDIQDLKEVLLTAFDHPGAVLVGRGVEDMRDFKNRVPMYLNSAFVYTALTFETDGSFESTERAADRH